MNFNTLTVIQTIFCAEFHSNFIWILKKREKNYLYLDRWLNLSNILQWTDKLFIPFNIHFCRMGLCTLRNYKYGYVSINWMLFFFMIECLLLKKIILNRFSLQWITRFFNKNSFFLVSLFICMRFLRNTCDNPQDIV